MIKCHYIFYKSEDQEDWVFPGQIPTPVLSSFLSALKRAKPDVLEYKCAGDAKIGYWVPRTITFKYSQRNSFYFIPIWIKTYIKLNIYPCSIDVDMRWKILLVSNESCAECVSKWCKQKRSKGQVYNVSRFSVIKVN